MSEIYFQSISFPSHPPSSTSTPITQITCSETFFKLIWWDKTSNNIHTHTRWNCVFFFLNHLMCLILSPIFGKKNRKKKLKPKETLISFLMIKKRIKEKQENKRKVMDFCCCPCPVSGKFEQNKNGKRCVVCGSKR